MVHFSFNGSFIKTFTKSLNYKAEGFAKEALLAKHLLDDLAHSKTSLIHTDIMTIPHTLMKSF